MMHRERSIASPFGNTQGRLRSFDSSSFRSGRHGKNYTRKRNGEGRPFWAAPLLATRARRFVRSAGALVLYGQDVDCAGGAQADYVGLAGLRVGHQPILRAIVLGQVPYHFANIRDPGCAQRMPLREQAARYVYRGLAAEAWMLAAALVDELAG